jgi:hypothetical protein
MNDVFEILYNIHVFLSIILSKVESHMISHIMLIYEPPKLSESPSLVLDRIYSAYDPVLKQHVDTDRC